MDPTPTWIHVSNRNRLVAYCHSFYIFYNFTVIQHTYDILLYSTRGAPVLISSLHTLGRGPPVECRAEIRTRPAYHQSDALLSEPRCKFFSIFGHKTPRSGSVFSLKYWIRIKLTRIRNTVPSWQSSPLLLLFAGILSYFLISISFFYNFFVSKFFAFFSTASKSVRVKF
jgi:hypothetical protein